MMKSEIKLKLIFNFLEELTRKYNETFELKEKLMKELREKAMYDPLTGIYNRYVLIEFLEKELERLKRTRNEKFYVIFMDLDHFKTINDILGHKKGDEILKQVAEILRNSFRKYDIVSRFGGDEFVAVLIDNNSENIDSILNRIRERIESSFSNYGISMSYGIAIAPDEGMDAYELIQIADDKMYEMKRKKKEEKTFFPFSSNRCEKNAQNEA
jgi:diguanylate cyclase (GGDEF)-like protein